MQIFINFFEKYFSDLEEAALVRVINYKIINIDNFFYEKLF